MTEVHLTVETNDIRMHLAEAGRGPLVLLCHGFPECWYSWRHQLAALSSLGVVPSARKLLADKHTMKHRISRGTGSSNPAPSSEESSANSVRDSAEYRGRHRPQAGLSGVRYELMQV
jgi:pimeloyl-ACP methyl ester carboxylesterase